MNHEQPNERQHEQINAPQSMGQEGNRQSTDDEDEAGI